MANRPANAGSGRGLASGNAAPPVGPAAPPAVHREIPQGPRSHRAVRPRRSAERQDLPASGLAWLPYLIVLAGAATGVFLAWQGPRYAGRGAALVGCSLLVAALARLVLPSRLAGLLSSRRKASDAVTFAVFGAAVLALALALP